MKKAFYGWWITFAAVITFGLSTGLPYYTKDFFYDYYHDAFGWSRSEMTLGFPIAALLTIWAGPLLIHRFSPRKLIIIGTGLTFVALTGFGTMGASLPVYYLLWIVYTIGYIVSGPIPHQILVSNWFRANRGKAMGIVYVGVGLIGAAAAKGVPYLTAAFGFHKTLIILGASMFLAWPVAWFMLRDKPAEMGQFPDGALVAPKELSVKSRSFQELMSSGPFWLMLFGSFCSIGSIGAVNVHMKLVFLDAGFPKGGVVDGIWSNAQTIILIASIAGRVAIGAFADKFSKKWVMTATYFIVAATIPLLVMVKPPGTPLAFAILFGFAMGADYMLIPLMAAEQFGVNSLPRAMAIILPVNTIGQTWFPYFVARLQEHFGSYTIPMETVFGLSLLGAVAIMLLPRHDKEQDAIFVGSPQQAAAKG
jgi:MFS family permease